RTGSSSGPPPRWTRRASRPFSRGSSARPSRGRNGPGSGGPPTSWPRTARPPRATAGRTPPGTPPPPSPPRSPASCARPTWPARPLEVTTPNGPYWHRHDHDGYGEFPDGRPWDLAGRGRAWPLLTGERGEYELAAGHPQRALALLTTLAKAGGNSMLLPEQVWD